jgi:hypothetical protein
MLLIDGILMIDRVHDTIFPSPWPAPICSQITLVECDVATALWEGGGAGRNDISGTLVRELASGWDDIRPLAGES